MALISRRPERDTLWLLTISPIIWAAHLLLCYITAAIGCGRFFAPGGSLDSVLTGIAFYTVVALAGIAFVGWEGFRRHRHGTEATTHDLDSAEDRHRFLGFATLLLSGLSALAVAYVALAVTFFDTCR